MSTDTILPNYITPTRLVMIYCQDNCMFCEDPKGPSYMKYVHLEEKLGYIYCKNCQGSADEAIEYWTNNVAYGKANYLQHRDIQIRRTSGEIESGWEVYNPFVYTNEEGLDKIQCYNKTQNLCRWCKLDDILELNPPAVLV